MRDADSKGALITGLLRDECRSSSEQEEPASFAGKLQSVKTDSTRGAEFRFQGANPAGRSNYAAFD